MVEVLYMDGSSEKLTGANIKYGDPPGCYIATAVYGSYDCPRCGPCGVSGIIPWPPPGTAGPSFMPTTPSAPRW